MERTPIKIAVIGLGLWGTRAHLPVLLARDDVEVTAVVDPIDEDGRALARRLGVPRVESDAAALWRDPDGIGAAIIATPVDTHRDLVLAAFAAGMHVLCEKPLAYDLAQAEEMARAARDHGKVGKMGFLFRFSPVVSRMKQLVDEGYVGPVQLFESRSVNAQFIDPARPLHWKMQRVRANGGVFAEYGSHAIDLALWFGGPMTKVVAHGVTLIPERPLAGGGTGRVDVEDAAAWIGVYDGGAQATFRMGWASLPVAEAGLRVHGPQGSLAWLPDPVTRGRETLLAATLDDPVPRTIFAYEPPHDPTFDEGSFPVGLAGRYNARLIDSFIVDIQAGRATGPSFDDGLAAQRVLAAIRASLDEERWAAVTDG